MRHAISEIERRRRDERLGWTVVAILTVFAATWALVWSYVL